MARVPYPDDDEILDPSLVESASDPEAAATDLGRSLDADELNVFRAMAHTAPALAGFREYVATLWSHCGLTARERQLLILAVAAQAESAYEWHQHVRVALDEGLTPDEIRAVSTGDVEPLEPEFVAIIEYASRFVEGRVDDATHERLATHYDDAEIVGIGMIASAYLGLAHFLDALAVDTEVEFVGWTLENLPGESTTPDRSSHTGE